MKKLLWQIAYSVWISVFLMIFHGIAYADSSGLLNGQILHIACNGDVTDQSDIKHQVENNGVIFVSDRLGKRERACFFDGSDYLRIPKNQAFNLSNFTIAAYVLVEGTYNGEARAIVSNYDKYSGSAAGTFQHYGIGMAAAGAASVFYDNGTGLGGAKDVNFSLANGEWHHVAAVFQGGSNVKLYVDGVSKRQSLGTLPAIISPTGDLFIGRGGSSELIEKRWVGSLDEVRIFNRALSANELNQVVGIVDLPTGETFTPLGTGENSPFLLEVKGAPLPSVLVTPNPEGGVSLNRFPGTGAREGERGLPPETSTLVLNNGQMTYLDEAKPGVVATVNLAGDLEVTDAKIPDLKLILPRLDNRFTFLMPSNPSIKVTVNHDGSLEIFDENQPNLSAIRNRDGSYIIVDKKANTVTLAERNGDAVLSHPDAPGIVATFNIFDSTGRYSLVDTATNACIEIVSGPRGGFGDCCFTGVRETIKSSVGSVISTFAKSATQPLFTAIKTGGAALASTATAATGGLSSWWACLPGVAKFAIVGGVVAAVAAIGFGIYTLKKEINKLRKEVQVLQATVQQQAETIRQLQGDVAKLQQVIAEQAQKIDEQAQKIAALEDRVAKQDEEIKKQKELNEASQKRIADLEDRVARAKEGGDKIPPGEPTIPTSGTKAGVRTSEACVQVPEIPLIALQGVTAEVVNNNKVVVKWQTLAELANVGFNVYRATKDTVGQFTDITKINDTLIPTQGNGTATQAYVYEDYPQPLGKTYYYAIESVDTEGKTFLFDSRVVETRLATLATLGDFTATPIQHNILLQWETEAEINSVGFNIWRAKVPADGQCKHKRVEEYQEVTKLTDRLVSAKGLLFQGSSYTYEDDRVVPKTSYCYGLEEIAKDGMSTFYWDWIATATAR